MEALESVASVGFLEKEVGGEVRVQNEDGAGTKNVSVGCASRVRSCAVNGRVGSSDRLPGRVAALWQRTPGAVVLRQASSGGQMGLALVMSLQRRRTQRLSNGVGWSGSAGKIEGE